jgi:hypothetical protein
MPTKKKPTKKAATPKAKGEKVVYQSKYGCYDGNMNPSPTWDVPATFQTQLAGTKPVLTQYYLGARDGNLVFTATYHPHKDFIFPAKLNLMTKMESSAKLSKNFRPSIVLYMSPVKQNSFGYQVCAMASAACEVVCLDFSGLKVPQSSQRAAIARTDYYIAYYTQFWDRIYKEITNFYKLSRSAAKVEKRNAKLDLPKGTPSGELAVRLNGTSDRDMFGEFMTYITGVGLTLPKDIVFYDYTKVYSRVTFGLQDEMNNKWGVRHKVTYSISEEKSKRVDSQNKAAEILVKGGTCAAVFLVKAGKPLPKNLTFEYNGKNYSFPIIDGDASDDLMLDNDNVVIGLRAKQRAEKDTSGFAIPVFALNSDDVPKDVIFDFNKNKEVAAAACGLKPIVQKNFICPDLKGRRIIKVD